MIDQDCGETWLQSFREVGKFYSSGITAASSDPDGFINVQNVQFSDGTNSGSPGIVETFAAPGTYTATATVIDNLGATATTSTTFSVGAGSVSIMTSPPEDQQQQHQHKP